MVIVEPDGQGANVGTQAELADRIDLAELASRLTRCIDLKTFGAMAALYTTDAALVTPMGVVEGAEAISDFARRNHEAFERTQHLVSGTTVDFAGESALVTVDVVAVFVPTAAAPGTNMHIGSRYELATVRDGGAWRIARHTITPIWQSEDS